MNQKRFIKLVNLYLDNEISVAQLGELKRAIASDDSKRTIFYQFCKLHIAEKKVFASLGESAASSHDSSVHVEFRGRKMRPYRFHQWASMAAGFAVLLLTVGVAFQHFQSNFAIETAAIQELSVALGAASETLTSGGSQNSTRHPLDHSIPMVSGVSVVPPDMTVERGWLASVTPLERGLSSGLPVYWLENESVDITQKVFLTVSPATTSRDFSLSEWAELHPFQADSDFSVYREGDGDGFSFNKASFVPNSDLSGW